jgi:hypothetical protein
MDWLFNLNKRIELAISGVDCSKKYSINHEINYITDDYDITDRNIIPICLQILLLIVLLSILIPICLLIIILSLDISY